MDNEAIEVLQNRIKKLEARLDKLGEIVEILVEHVKDLEGHPHLLT